MTIAAFPQRASEPEALSVFVKMTGTGNGTVPTKNIGRGVTLSYVSTGIVRFTFSDFQGTFIGGGLVGKQAATPSQLKGFDMVFGSLDATGKIIDANITNASQTLVDLQTGQIMSVELVFKAAGSEV